MKKLDVLLDAERVGTLAEVSTGEIYFEYAPDFLRTGSSISPYFLPLKPGVQREPSLLFGGLFGVFDDSLPDGWGLMLMDRELRRRGFDPDRVSPLDRLAYLGPRSLGALVYRPAASLQPPGPLPFELPEIAAQAERIAQGSPEEALPILLALGGSPAGARPKAVVGYHPGRRTLVADSETLPPGYERWIVKFRARNDDPEAGRIEAAYYAMAREAGLDVPPTELFPTSLGDFVGIKRFDRDAADRRIHTHTFGGLIHASFRMPNRDYREFLEVTFDLTKDHRALQEAYRRMVFNVLAHNRDDHVKNFAFQQRPARGWSLSPAYDLTFSDGVRGQHNTTVLGAGEPGPSSFMPMADAVGLDRRQAQAIADKARTAISRWDPIARDHKVSAPRRESISQALHRIAVA